VCNPITKANIEMFYFSTISLSVLHHGKLCECSLTFRLNAPLGLVKGVFDGGW
jgi:hypothetical protein